MLGVFLRQLVFICRFILRASVRLVCASPTCGRLWHNKSRACLNTRCDSIARAVSYFQKKISYFLARSEFSRAVTVTKYYFHILCNYRYTSVLKGFSSFYRGLLWI